MIQLTLLLLGVEATQRHWLTLATVGAIWAALGFGIVIDPLDGVQNITMHTLGLMLAFEGVVTAIAGLLSHAPRRLWVAKAVALTAAGLMIVETPWRNVVLISVLFGLALLVDGCVRLASTLLVRFPGWRLALVASGIELVLAILALTPWPVSYEATVPFCVGVAFMLSGWTVIRSAFQLRRLPPGAPITSLPIFERQRGWHAPSLLPETPAEPDREDAGERLIVHVWTPLASSADPVRRPLLDRYIAGVDRKGTIATGHAGLESPPDLYISHYRAQEQDRSSVEFRRALHGGEQNSVPGRFLPSYREESAEWCDSTVQVVFHRFNAVRLRAFWAAYRRNSTYNLTNRNCSIAVALALDAALEGVLGDNVVWPPFLRLLIHPDLYLATLLRKRAQTMTWTPGLLLDYARAMHHLVEPPPGSWIVMLAAGGAGVPAHPPHERVRTARGRIHELSEARPTSTGARTLSAAAGRSFLADRAAIRRRRRGRGSRLQHLSGELGVDRLGHLQMAEYDGQSVRGKHFQIGILT
jgi:uncharacterized membrane protein HdeD (DUF308 family)